MHHIFTNVHIHVKVDEKNKNIRSKMASCQLQSEASSWCASVSAGMKHSWLELWFVNHILPEVNLQDIGVVTDRQQSCQVLWKLWDWVKDSCHTRCHRSLTIVVHVRGCVMTVHIWTQPDPNWHAVNFGCPATQVAVAICSSHVIVCGCEFILIKSALDALWTWRILQLDMKYK